MNFIDKSIHENQGNLIVDELLERSWIADQNQYINANYEDGLCNNKYSSYNDLTNILLENQHNNCCYCMKDITPAETTLEHIIPHKTKTQIEFNRYLVSNQLSNNVIYSSIFDKLTKIIPPLKYPHDVAYHNLVASCDSNSHCNHYRGNKYINTLFYDANIGEKIEYDDEGIAFSAEYIDDLAALGLSITEDLKIYRKMWCEFSKTKADAEDVTEEDIEMLALTLKGDNKFERQLANFYGTPSKRQELLKYKWFFNYYK